MYLLDTNVISELRKVREGKADPQVAAWQAQVSQGSCFVSAITLMELEIGVLRMERRDARRGALLRLWLEDRVLPEFAARVLPVDVVAARHCARLHVPDLRPERDALIAATALAHGLTVVTRNTADFAPAGVALLNPWEPWTLQEKTQGHAIRG